MLLSLQNFYRRNRAKSHKLRLIIGIAIPFLPAPLEAGPRWVSPVLHLGSLDSDGRLYHRIELAKISVATDITLPFLLEHVSSDDELGSHYRIPQLETYVVPEDRDKILWVEPGGYRHIFKLTEISKSEVTVPENRIEGWTAFARGSDHYEFHSDDGFVYSYRSGSIQSLSLPGDNLLEFETNGVYISKIFHVNHGKKMVVLDVASDKFGQPEQIRIGETQLKLVHHPTTGQLVSCRSARPDLELSFNYYDDGLIENVTTRSGISTFKWGADGSWQNDSGLDLPTGKNRKFLSEDTNFKYRYGTNKEGLNLIRINRSGASEGLSYNPKTRQLIRKHLGGGQTVEFYGGGGNSKNRIISARDSAGREVLKRSYDDKGRVIENRGSDGTMLRFAYDNNNRILSVSREDKVLRSYEYNSIGNKPTKITNALGHSILIEYEGENVRKITDLEGAITEFEYDSEGNLRLQKIPMGYVKTIQRDNLGRVAKITDFDGTITEFSYNNEQRIQEVSTDRKTIQFEFDKEKVQARLLEDGVIWQTSEIEKLVESTTLVKTSVDDLGDESVSIVESESSGSTITDPLGNKTSLKLNQEEGVLKIDSDTGDDINFKLDEEGRIVQLSNEESGNIEFAYDASGKLRKKSVADKLTKYTYDHEGRVSRTDYPSGYYCEYKYDYLGRLQCATTSEGVKTSFQWDELDRKIYQREDLPTGDYTLIKWEYTPGGKKSSIFVERNPTSDSKNSPQFTSYEYDELGRYSRIKNNGKVKVVYEYDKATMRLKEKKYDNGCRIQYGYSNEGKPISLQVFDSEDRNVKDISYKWARNGKLDVRIVDGKNFKYRYDKLGRLTGVLEIK